MLTIPALTPRATAPAKPLEIYVCPFTVLESNAEQAPWSFQSIVLGDQQWVIPRKRQHMKTADYSMEVGGQSFEDRILIERKADDFVSSITTERARFEREHERMKAVVDAGGFACMISELSLSSICDALDDPYSDRKVSSDTVIGTVATWPRRYGVNWFFVGDRRRAELLAFRILWKFYQEQHDGQ